MIDFLVRAWFEKRELKTKEEFISLKEKQFNELVEEIKSFCNRCWESKSWEELWSHFDYMRRSEYSHSHRDWVYDELKKKYEAFAKEHGACIETLIEIYNNFYDEIWKNTDLDVSKIICPINSDRISYELHKTYTNRIVPEFDHYAIGWNQKWHTAYCALANIMLLLNKCCGIVGILSDHFKDEYKLYYFYLIKREDRPKNEDRAVYEEAKQKLESEINVETSIKKEDVEVEARKLVLESGFCKTYMRTAAF